MIVTVEEINKAHEAKADRVLNYHAAASRKAEADARMVEAKADIVPQGKNEGERKRFVESALTPERTEVVVAAADLLAAETQLKLARNEIARIRMIADCFSVQ